MHKRHTTALGVFEVHPRPAAAGGGGGGGREHEVLGESLDVLGGLLLDGPWGLPPPVLRNLTLENCKFIAQKGPRAGEDF